MAPKESDLSLSSLHSPHTLCVCHLILLQQVGVLLSPQCGALRSSSDGRHASGAGIGFQYPPRTSPRGVGEVYLVYVFLPFQNMPGNTTSSSFCLIKFLTKFRGRSQQQGIELLVSRIPKLLLIFRAYAVFAYRTPQLLFTVLSSTLIVCYALCCQFSVSVSPR